MATLRPARRFFFSRMVIMSSRACVGCSWAPSACVDDGLPDHPGEHVGRARGAVAQHDDVRVHGLEFRAVSTKVSPLTTLLVEVVMLIVSALSLLAAISKEVLVRVLGS